MARPNAQAPYDSPIQPAHTLQLHSSHGHDDGDVEKKDSTMPEPASEGSAGVTKVEMFNRVLHQSGRSGKMLLWLLGVSVGLTMFVYALDQAITTQIFSAWASSSFAQHANLAAVSTASQIIRAISKPFLGKLADLTSRPTTYVVVLVFYVIGFVIAASAQTFPAYTVGVALTAAGKSGLDLLSDIIIGDLTPLEWRGFFSASLSLPFVVTVPINGFIVDGLKGNWRWGMGMFAIMIPVLLTPAIATLYYIQNKGKQMQLERQGPAAESGPTDWRTHVQRIRIALIEIDMPGLILLGFAFALILLPFTLAKGASKGWANPSMIAMIVVGFVLLVIFILFEIHVAPKPLMTRRIMRNRAFIAAVTINIFSQCASSIRNTYLYSYISVIKPWGDYTVTIVIGITTIGLCLMGPITGLLQRYTHRYKNLMVIGAIARMLGYGILVNAGSNSMTTQTGRIIASQLIFCLGSLVVVGARVGSQASVPHEDLASIISLISLWSTLGSSVGSAIASAIWTQRMQAQLTSELPDVAAATIKRMYGSITFIKTFEYSSELRDGVTRAYSQVMGYLGITAVCFAALPVIATLFMPDYYLGKQQNAADNKGLDGELVSVPSNEKNCAGRGSQVVPPPA